MRTTPPNIIPINAQRDKAPPKNKLKKSSNEPFVCNFAFPPLIVPEYLTTKYLLSKEMVSS